MPKRILVYLVLVGAILTSCAPQAAPVTVRQGSAAPVSSATSLPGSTATSTHMPTRTSTTVPSETTISPPPEEALQWLKMNAIGFSTTQPGTGCEDLQPLLAMIGEARVVALGEATHGTHEFFTMKQRILECLVQEKGFTLFA
jgi:hypothetical protein